MGNVLIVDDSEIIRFQLKNIIEDLGHRVIGEAENGRQGFDKYKIFRPDLVTMDITMPEEDGISCLKKIKEFDPAAKVIMITALGQKALVVEAIRAGAKDYIVKPFVPDKIAEKLKKFL